MNNCKNVNPIFADPLYLYKIYSPERYHQLFNYITNTKRKENKFHQYKVPAVLITCLSVFRYPVKVDALLLDKKNVLRTKMFLV